jgi:hypothetical protein
MSGHCTIIGGPCELRCPICRSWAAEMDVDPEHTITYIMDGEEEWE